MLDGSNPVGLERNNNYILYITYYVISSKAHPRMGGRGWNHLDCVEYMVKRFSIQMHLLKPAACLVVLPPVLRVRGVETRLVSPNRKLAQRVVFVDDPPDTHKLML